MKATKKYHFLIILPILLIPFTWKLQKNSFILKSLQVGKACGPDMINDRILRKIADSISPILTDLFNTSLSFAHVPDIWKRSNISPVYKNMVKIMLPITNPFH